MIEEELKQKAIEYRKRRKQEIIDDDDFEKLSMFDENVEEAYIASAEENGIVWYKVTDWKDQYQFPQEETFPFVVQTKKDGYYLCEWEITEGYGQFYSMYEGEEIDPKDVIKWARIPLKEEMEK